MIALLYLVKASLVLLLTAITLAFPGHRWSAATRHVICTIAVAGLLALPVLSIALPGWEAVHVAVTEQYSSAIVPETPPIPTPAFERTLASRTVQTVVVPPPTSARDEFTSEPSVAMSWGSVASLVYLAGAVMLIGRLLVEHIVVRRMLRKASTVAGSGWDSLLDECTRQLTVRSQVRLLTSVEQRVPMAVGIQRPAVFMPETAGSWPADARRIVLLHELAHVARRDCLTQMAAALMSALYWPHPGVWWLARRLRIERELACDDLVLASGANPHDYASMLLEFWYAQRVHAVPALALGMASSQSLEGRLLALIDAARNRTAPTRRTRLTAVAVGLSMIVPIAAATVAARQPAGNSTSEAIGAARHEGERDDYRRYLSVDYWRTAAKYELWRLMDQLNYLSEMRKLGYSMIDVEQLITLRQHGVTPDYVRALAGEGLAGLSTGDRLTAIRHGISSDYVRGLKGVGYQSLDVEALTRLRRHGVDADFIRELRAIGLREASIDALIAARSHGISPDYVRDLQALGYHWSIDELATARSHGIDAAFLRELSSLGYENLPLDVLTELRSHGVEPSFIRELHSIGYVDLTPEELSELRRHGVTAAKARQANADAGTHLSVGQLTDLASHGWKP